MRCMRIYRVAEELPPKRHMPVPAVEAWAAVWGPPANASGGRNLKAPAEAPSPSASTQEKQEPTADVQQSLHSEESPDIAPQSGKRVKHARVKKASSDSPSPASASAWEAAKETAAKAGKKVKAAKDAVVDTVAGGWEATKQAATKLTGMSAEDTAVRGKAATASKKGLGPGWEADPQANMRATNISARALEAGEQWDGVKGSSGAGTVGAALDAAKGTAEALAPGEGLQGGQVPSAVPGEGWQGSQAHLPIPDEGWKAADSMAEGQHPDGAGEHWHEDWEALRKENDAEATNGPNEKPRPSYPHSAAASRARACDAGRGAKLQ